jgi:EmrB/QacA subfamily drug resistance transporter
MSTQISAREAAAAAAASTSSQKPTIGQGKSRWVALVVLGLAQLMVVLDATIVNIALPHAQAALHISNDGRQWVVTGYALAFGSLLLLGGRLSDFFGRKRMFIIGLVGFAAASALGGAATDFTTLLAARVLQGAFGAALAPAALSLLSTTFTGAKDRGRAFGIFGSISGAGGAVGLLLGGVLTEYASWRWCLYVNVIIAVVAVIGAVIYVQSGERAPRSRLDIPGTVTAVIGQLGIVYGFGSSESYGWTDSRTLVPIVVGVLALIAFVLIERRSSHPLLPLRVILDRNRGAAYLSVAIVGAGMFGVFLFVTYYLTGILQFTPLQTGLGFLPMTLAIMLAATMSGSVLLPRVGPRPLVPTGAIIAAAGMVMLTGIGVHSSYAGSVLPALIVMGLGIGLIFGPVQNAATSGVESRDAGVASAMVNTAQQIGGSIGTALLSSFSASAISGYLASHQPLTSAVTADATVAGYHLVFWIAAAPFAAGAVISVALFRSGPLQVNPDAEPVIAH